MLAKKTPEQVANLIVAKLVSAGVELPKTLSYSDNAKADVDFPMARGKAFTKLLTDLKSHNWYTQEPAIGAIFELDWSTLTPDQIFVLGRNIYQCADGEERSAKGILANLIRELAKLPEDAALHLLNGMFFETYFNSEGECTHLLHETAPEADTETEQTLARGLMRNLEGSFGR